MAGLPKIAGAILAFVFLSYNLRTLNCFNLDVESYTTYRGEPDSMFGFSVALHRESGLSWVLVGAPQAQTPQPKVRRGGAVYRCDISRSSCDQVPFDLNGNSFTSSNIQWDDKSGQWFGASVYSAGEDGPVVACAPRYIFHSTQFKLRDPVGTCYLGRNKLQNFSEYAPCRTQVRLPRQEINGIGEWGYSKLGHCQAGLGVAISRDGERLFIGAVGSRYWQGQLYSINDRLINPPRLPSLWPSFINAYISNFEDGQMISQSTFSRPDVVATGEEGTAFDNTYLGYSVAVGDFGGGIPGHDDVAAGRPKAADLLGQVLLYTWNLKIIKNITGEQLASYFGYAIASSDVDGDGRDDLIIGAPLYTDFNNNEGKYETGRVYIIYQGTQTVTFNKLSVKDGKNSKGRFGLALTSLGDINKDNYGDFAVGAPYDGPEERGAVYIFHGSASGVRDSHSQVIYAEDVGSPFTFGFSIRGGLDLDENNYPDLVVGAYESNTALFFRARPVVKAQATINFLLEGRQISLDGKHSNCTLRDRTKVPCTKFTSCLTYEGIGVDNSLGFDVQYVLDSKKPKSPRMFFLNDENKSLMKEKLVLKIGQKHCKQIDVYLKPNIRDKLTSVDAEIRYSLSENYNNRRLQRQLIPILDLNEGLSKKDSILIKKNCGNDNICIPDLRLIARPSVKRYLLGSGERFQLIVTVQNEGEDAFEAVFKASIPPGMNYVKIERVDDADKEIPVQCSPPSFLNNNTLHCDIGNPLPKDKLVQFNVILQPYHKDGMKPRYEFEMIVNSTNPENNISTSDNVMHINVPIWVETDLILQGSSHPADVHYNSSLYYKTDNFTHESEIGPQVIHVYGIRNKGPSDIDEAVAYFLWPSYTLAGDHLLYLLEQPETFGNIRCEHVREANVEHLILEKRKGYLNHQEIPGVQSKLTKSESSSSSHSSSSSSSSSSGTKMTESHSSSSFSHSSSGKVLTAEERNRLEGEEFRRQEKGKQSTEGGSIGRKENKIQEEHSHYSSNGGRLESFSHSRLIPERGRVEVSKTPIGTESRFSENADDERSSGVNKGISYNRGHSGRGHVHYEEKEESSNTTWHSGGTPKTVTHTKGTTVDDGVQKSGSSSNVQSGFREGNINLANLGLSSEGNRIFSIGGGEGVKVYTEERHYEKSSTWNSQDGAPKVSESSSWKTNRDGVITSGSSKNSYDEKVVEGGAGSRGSVTGTRQSIYHDSTRQRTTGIQSSEHEHAGSRRVNEDLGYSQGRQETRRHEETGHRETDDEMRVTHSSRQHSGGNSQGSEHRAAGSRVHEEETHYGGTRTYSSGQNIDYEREQRNRQEEHRRTSMVGSEHQTASTGASSRDSEHKIAGSRVHEGETNYGGSRTYSSGQNIDYEREQRNRQEEQHRRTSIVGSEHQFAAVGGVHEEKDTRHGGRRIYSESHNVDYDRDHRNRQEGVNHRESYEDSGTNSQSGGRRNEGRHRVHWSSEHGTKYEDSEVNKDLTKVEEDIRHALTSGSNSKEGNKHLKTYEEERHHEWNTTWRSGDKPKTTEHTRWSFNEDGTIKNGSHTETYEGTARIDKDLNKHIMTTNIGSGAAEIDRNLIETGNRGTKYSEEKVSTYNTTWSSATGGQPITTAHTSWKVNKDGIVSSGSKSDVFEGTPPVLHGNEEKILSEASHGGRAEHSNYDIRHESSRGHSSHQNRFHESQGHHHNSNREGLNNGRVFEGSVGSSNSDYNERTRGSHHQSGATSINVGDLMKGSQSSNSQSTGFNQFGEIAKGPQDGVAKTYTLDLGINSGGRDGSSSRHHEQTRHHSNSGGSEFESRHETKENSRSSYGKSEGRNEDLQGYSYRNADRIEGYGGGSSMHSSWSHSSTLETADGDNPQHGGAYGVRKVTDSAYPKHISDESSKGQFQHYPRFRRETGEESCENLSCGPTDCTCIKCTLGALKKDEEAMVAFRARVWVPTMRKFSTSVDVSSLVVARVTLLPHIGSPDVTTHTHEVHSQIMPPDSAVKPDIIPLWIVVVSACAGAIILMLLVYLLYKCGFFKRNRPSNAPEKQPLNRNGHYHGDEAL